MCVAVFLAGIVLIPVLLFLPDHPPSGGGQAGGPQQGERQAEGELRQGGQPLQPTPALHRRTHLLHWPHGLVCTAEVSPDTFLPAQIRSCTTNTVELYKISLMRGHSEISCLVQCVICTAFVDYSYVFKSSFRTDERD